MAREQPISPERKAAARDSSNAWERFNVQSGGLFAAAGMFLIDVAPPGTATAIAAVGTVVTVRARYLEVTSRQLSDDPARTDFDVPVEPIRPPLHEGALGDDAYAVAGMELARVAGDSGAWLSAVVLATERAEGASLAGKPDYEAQRLDEAHRFLLDASRALRDVERAANEFAAVLSGDAALRAAAGAPGARSAFDEVAERPLLEVMQPDVFALVLDTGVERSELDFRIDRPDEADPVGDVASRLTEAGAAAAELGGQLGG
ncbi:MAG TPA: hypothetical protein VF752_17325 [Thermoleophilaceae bacterium]